MTTEPKLLTSGQAGLSSEAEEIAQAILPQLYGDGIGDTSESNRAKYLAKRVCYFSVREAARLSGVCEKTIRRWRESDPAFRELDTVGITKLREYLGSHLIEMQFTRNMTLALEKDFTVLYKDATNPNAMTDDDKKYLNRIRQYYTPQALSQIKALVSGKEPDGDEGIFDFSKFVVTLKRKTETQEIHIEGER